jgi:uncharacterized protein VirK/YbjX
MLVFKPLSSLVFTVGSVWTTWRGVDGLGTGVGDWRTVVRRARKGAALLIDPWTHLQVARVFGRREVRPILLVAPWMTFKYLTEYLKTGLSRKQRASILVHHYTLLSSRAHGTFFRTITDGRVELWKEPIGDHTYRMLLTFPSETHAEGDLALVFRADATDIYTLSFTFGPGTIAGLRASNVMYIARVQGKGGALELIRNSTRECLDISPPALLLAAAEGIAAELKLEHMVGIGATTQLSGDDTRPGGLITAYDEFWTALGGQRLQGDMFHLTVPLAEKPLTSIKRCHRSRVRRKRAFKKLVAERVRAQFRVSFVEDTAKTV